MLNFQWATNAFETLDPLHLELLEINLQRYKCSADTKQRKAGKSHFEKL